MKKRQKPGVLTICLCLCGMFLFGCSNDQPISTKGLQETVASKELMEEEMFPDMSKHIAANLQRGEKKSDEAGGMVREEYVGEGVFTNRYLSQIKMKVDGILTELLNTEGRISPENSLHFSSFALEQMKAADWPEIKKKWSRSEEEGKTDGYSCFCRPNLLWADSGYEFVYVYEEEAEKEKTRSDRQGKITWLKLVISENGIIQGFFVGEETNIINNPWLVAGLKADTWFVDAYMEKVIAEGKPEGGKILAAPAQMSENMDISVADSDQRQEEYIDVSSVARQVGERLLGDMSANREGGGEEVLLDGGMLSPYYDVWYYPAYSTENEFALVYYLYPDFERMNSASGEAMVLYALVDKESKEFSFLQAESVFLEREEYQAKREKIDLRFLVVEDGWGTTRGVLRPREAEENIFGEQKIEEFVEKVGEVLDNPDSDDGGIEELFTDPGAEQFVEFLAKTEELAREGWKRAEKNIAYYYPQNEQEGRGHFRFYYYWNKGEASVEKMLGMDVWISPEGIEEIRTEWLWRKPIQEEEASHRADALMEFSRKDIELYLQTDWTRDELLTGFEREIGPNGSGDGWDFSLADIDFDGRPEMLVTISYWAGGNSLYVYRQQGDEVISYMDTYAVFGDRFYSELDPTEISPYLNIDLLGIYVNEAGEYRYLSTDCSLHGGDIRGGWGEFILYETKLEPGAAPEEIAKVSYVYPEENMELYFKGEKVYGKAVLGELLEKYMEGWNPVDWNYATAKTQFARDIVGWELDGREARKEQELQNLYQDLQELVSW